MAELRKKAEEHCGKGIPEKVFLLELGWYMKEVIVTYMQCKRCGEKEYHIEENRRQEVIKDRQRWYRYTGKAVQPREAKAQQSSAQPKESEGVAKEESSQKEVRRTFKMLREVWLNIGIEKKIDIYKGIIIKAILNSGATEMFIDKRMVAKHGFKL